MKHKTFMVKGLRQSVNERQVVMAKFVPSLLDLQLGFEEAKIKHSDPLKRPERYFL